MKSFLSKLLAIGSNPYLAYLKLRHDLDFSEMLITAELQQSKLLDGVGLVVDAGAHYGKFATSVSRVLSDVRIACFEPVPRTFVTLTNRTRNYPNITCHRFGLGAATSQKEINVSALDQASSFLPMTDLHKSLWPESSTNQTVLVDVVTLDGFMAKYKYSGCLYLKADIQGFELDMLKGASEVLKRTKIIRLELSFVSLYCSAPSVAEIFTYLEGAGFRFHSVVSTVIAPDSNLPVQGDVVFVNKSMI